ncbi:ribonuclease III [Eubacteriales bacterium OttesenSCG-928-M02]|nr:ribonuclease III [Eubacteriales bacterium OttesenSCG-928-M02]
MDQKQMQRGMQSLQDKLGYHFIKEETLQQALTHSSFDGDKNKNNQRLEFLGDAVLQLIISDELYRDQSLDEGQMTRLRSLIVRGDALYEEAKKFGLGKMLILGKGEELSGGREKSSILADTMEAVIGAIYVDGGMGMARSCVLLLMRHAIKTALGLDTDVDYKTQLQQLSANHFGKDVKYKLVHTEGPAHERVFTVKAMIGNREVGLATGHSKKEGEMQAARKGVALLKKEGIG